MNPKTITRRQLAKGAAWSAPVILATTIIPAYAASASSADLAQGVGIGQTNVTTCSATQTCSDAQGLSGYTMNKITVANDSSLYGKVPPEQAFGFVILTEKAITKVELDGLRYYVGFPAGLIDTSAPYSGVNFVLGSRSWKLNGILTPQVGEKALDVFQFDYTGPILRQSLVWSGRDQGRPQTWEDTFFKIEFAVKPDFCLSQQNFQVFSGYYADRIVAGAKTWQPYDGLGWQIINQPKN